MKQEDKIMFQSIYCLHETPFLGENEKYHYLYRITNRINGKIYIGIHSTASLDDLYMGSGIRLHEAYAKYGIEHFTKDILKFCNSREELYSLEKEIVNKSFVNREDVYNISLGGSGVYGLSGEKNHFYGKRHTEETKERMRKNHADFKLGKHPEARKVQKFDLEGNLIMEYACLCDCYTTEKMSNHTLWKYIKSGMPYKGYVYKYADPSLYLKPYRAKSKETRLKLSKNHKGPSGKNHNCSKQIVKVDKEDNIVEIYCSIKEAADMNGFKNPLSIKQRLYNGKPHNGYFYKFAEDINNE